MKQSLDIGNSHVIAWYCWKALRDRFPLREAPNYLAQSEAHDKYFASQDWSRYDGELL